MEESLQLLCHSIPLGSPERGGVLHEVTWGLGSIEPLTVPHPQLPKLVLSILSASLQL